MCWGCRVVVHICCYNLVWRHKPKPSVSFGQLSRGIMNLLLAAIQPVSKPTKDIKLLSTPLMALALFILIPAEAHASGGHWVLGIPNALAIFGKVALLIAAYLLWRAKSATWLFACVCAAVAPDLLRTLLWMTSLHADRFLGVFSLLAGYSGYAFLYFGIRRPRVGERNLLDNQSVPPEAP
jgi:hypothetical protein